MVPWTCFKFTCSLKPKCANSALQNLKSKASDILKTNFVRLFKKLLKQFAHLHSTPCHTMSVEQIMPLEGFTECQHVQKVFPVLLHPDWGPRLGSGKHRLYLKDLENKNLTCKNLSIALISWHFIKMLAFQKLQNVNISPNKPSNQWKTLCQQVFSALWMNPPFCPTNTTHCKCQAFPGGVRGQPSPGYLSHLKAKVIPQGSAPSKAGFPQMPTSDTTKEPQHASSIEKLTE